jgi:hypothetical protein
MQTHNYKNNSGFKSGDLAADTINASQRPSLLLIPAHIFIVVHPVVQLVEALRYKAEGRSFDSRWGHWNV